MSRRVSRYSLATAVLSSLLISAPAHAACSALTDGVVALARLDSAGAATVFTQSTGTASATVEGAVAYDTTNDLLKVCDGTNWQSLSGGGGSQWINGASGAIYYNGGNVGIGTASPSSVLQVNRSGGFSGAVTSDLIAVFAHNSNSAQSASIAVVGGSAGSASLQLGGDGTSSYNNSRLVHNASSNALGIWTADTEKLTVTSGGNVGIGTTTPGAPLQVVRGTNTFSFFPGAANITPYYLQSTTGYTAIALMGGSAGTGLVFDNGHPFGIYADNKASLDGGLSGGGSELLRITPQGNVGVGTVSPSTRLDVLSTTGAQIRASYDTNRYMEITHGDILVHSLDAQNDPLTLTQQGGGDGIQFLTGTVASGATEKMRIKNNGNVGIGTSNPTGALQVHLSTDNNVLASSVGDKFGFINDAGNAWVNSNWAGLSHTFKVGAFASADAMFINSSGNVGIGTTSPQRALDVISGYAYGGLITGGAGAHAATVAFGSTFDATNASAIQGFSDHTMAATNALSLQPSGGNVGIGTTSPNAHLELGVNAGTDQAIKLNSDVADTYVTLGSYGNYGGLYSGGGVNLNLNSAGAGGYLTLSTVSAERVRIDSSGNVGIGTSNPGKPLHVKDAIVAVGNPSIRLEGATGGYGAGVEAGAPVSGGSYLAMGKVVWDGENSWNTTAGTQDAYFSVWLAQDGAQTKRLQLSSAGTLTVYGATTCVIGNGTGATNCTSDQRLKTDIAPISDALEKLSAISGVTFHWKDPLKSGAEHIGLIAQDVEKVFPQAVSEIPDEKLGSVKAIDYAVLVAPMIQALKELKAANDSLNAENNRLSRELDTIRRDIQLVKRSRN